MSTVTLACPRCGRPVPVPEDADLVLPVCAECEARQPEPLAATFTIRTATGSSSLDGLGVVERLRAGQLAGSDWIVAEDGSASLIAAHPTFAALYARGEIPEAVVVVVPPPAPPAAQRVVREDPAWKRALFSSLRVSLGVALLAGLGAGGLYAWKHSEELIGGLGSVAPLAGVEPLPAPEAAPGATAAAAVAPAAPLTPLTDALVVRVGAVEEPTSLLLAQAWAARLAGGRAGVDAALVIAQRAVARQPGNPDALAMLAEAQVLAGGQADLVDELLASCRRAAPKSQACARARGRQKLVAGDPEAAKGEVQGCAGNGDLGCREVYVGVAAADLQHPSEALGAVDKLARDWPANRELARLGALLATRSDLPEAPGRVERLRKEIDGDPDLDSAAAGLLLLDGDVRGAAAILGALAERAPAELRVAGASALVGAGDGAGAIALLGSLPTDSGMAEPVQRRARLALAQARYLVALRDPTAVPAATSAVESLVVMGRSDPAIAQVRAMVADLAGNRGEQARAWALMDESQRSGAALARVLDTQVALGIAQKLPVSELVPLAERARRADPQSPDTHLWLAWVHLVGHNAPQAVDVLRTSVQQVDGQVERRGPDAGVLRSPPEPGALLAALEEAVGNDATFGHAYHVSRATVHWLVGSPNSARKELEDAGDIDNDLDALALSARLRMAQKDNAGAILQWERITRERPKQGEYLLGYLQALVAAGRAAEGAQWVDTLSSSPLGSAMVPVIRAEIRVATGESAAAQRDLLDAIARDPLDVRSRIRYRKLALDSK